MSTYRKPPMHDHGRDVRGAALTCDECGDQLELRAHGQGVRAEHAQTVSRELVTALHRVAVALRWSITKRRHRCPRCAIRHPAAVSGEAYSNPTAKE